MSDMSMSASEQHKTRVVTYTPPTLRAVTGHRAVCSCGWESEPQTSVSGSLLYTFDEATDRAAEHMERTRSEPDEGRAT